jgi:hypothetical protein
LKLGAINARQSPQPKHQSLAGRVLRGQTLSRINWTRTVAYAPQVARDSGMVFPSLARDKAGRARPPAQIRPSRPIRQIVTARKTGASKIRDLIVLEPCLTEPANARFV